MIEGSPCADVLSRRALWSKDECRQMCWQLDPTEGPGRVRRRMMRAPLTVARRYIISETRSGRGGEREEEEGKDKGEFITRMLLHVCSHVVVTCICLSVESKAR